MKKLAYLLGLVMACLLVGCSSAGGSIYAPGKLTTNVDGSTITTSWEEVPEATAYECTYEGADGSIEVQKTSFTITNADEGKVTVKVRSIKDTVDGRLYSEWTKATVEVPYSVGEPGEISASLDGSYISFVWDAGAHADSYECIWTDENGEHTFTANNNSMGIKFAKEGTTYGVKVRSTRETPNGTLYSDWKQGSISTPTIDYSDVDIYGATFLDSEQIVTWAKTNGFKYSVDTTEDEKGNSQTVVTVHYKDELNSGFFNSAGRILTSAIAGFLGGYSEQLESDYSSIEDIVNGYVQAGSLSEYANTFDANATQSGKVGAFAGAINAMLLDTDIYYQYYYSHPSKGADLGTAYFLKNKRENFESSNFGKFTKDADGSYHLQSKIFQKNFNITVADVVVNGFQKWAIVTVPQK